MTKEGKCRHGLAEKSCIRMSEAVTEWLTERRVLEAKAHGTLVGNRRLIESVIGDSGDRWCHELDLKPFSDKIGKNPSLALSSANSMRAGLKAYWKFLAERGYLNRTAAAIDINRAIPSLKKKQHRADAIDRRFFLDPARFPEALEVAGQIHPSHEAFVAVGLFFSARGAAVEDLQFRDINGRKKTIGLFESKTGFAENNFPTQRLWPRLERWLAIYTDEYGEPEPDWYVFPRISNGRLGRGNPYHAVHPTLRRGSSAGFIRQTLLTMGFKEAELYRVGPHTLRRSGVTWWYLKVEEKYGPAAAMRFIMQLCGWATEQEALNYINPLVRFKWRNEIMQEIDFFGDDDPLGEDGPGALILPFPNAA